MRRIVILIVTLGLIVGLISLSADTIRGPVVEVGELPSPGDPDLEFTLETGQIASIQAAANPAFVDAIEMEIAVPESVRRFIGSFAIYVYSNPDPLPVPQLMTITATRVMLQQVPAAARFFVVLPANAGAGVHADAATVVSNSVVPFTSYPIIVTVQPVTKGLPDAAQQSAFEFRVRPVASHKGGLQLTIFDAANQHPLQWGSADPPVAVALNGQNLPYQNGVYVMDPGLYNLAVTSPDYGDETRTFTIDRGRINNIAIDLKRIESTIFLEAPQGTLAFLDGSAAPVSQRIVVAPGDHSIMFRVGDYTVNRRFTVEAKKDYDISLFLDIVVKEAK